MTQNEHETDLYPGTDCPLRRNRELDKKHRAKKKSEKSLGSNVTKNSQRPLSDARRPQLGLQDHAAEVVADDATGDGSEEAGDLRGT